MGNLKEAKIAGRIEKKREKKEMLFGNSEVKIL